MEKLEEKMGEVAIFIDLPNLIISARQFKYEANKAFYKILELTKQHGKIVEGYAYADFDRLRIDFPIVSHNIKLIHCPGNGNGESKMDDPMLIEGIHSALREDSNLSYVLVSSDIMILPVSMTLRSLNKDFRIYGFSQCASSLLKGLPEFIDLNQFLEKGNGYSPAQKSEIPEKVAC